MANLAPAFDTQFFDGQTVAAGYKLYTYETGTTTPKTTYSDQAGSVPNANPITLDADGRCSLWLGLGEYTFALYTREIGDGGALVKTWNDVSAVDQDDITAFVLAELADGSDSAKGSGMVGFNPQLNYASATIGARLKERVSVKDFPWLAKLDGVADDAAAINACIAWCGANARADVFIPDGTARCGSEILMGFPNLRVYGAGDEATVILVDHTGNGVNIATNNQPRLESLTIQRATIGARQSRTGTGLRVYGDVGAGSSVQAHVAHVRVEGFARGLDASGCFLSSFSFLTMKRNDISYYLGNNTNDSITFFACKSNNSVGQHVVCNGGTAESGATFVNSEFEDGFKFPAFAVTGGSTFFLNFTNCYTYENNHGSDAGSTFNFMEFAVAGKLVIQGGGLSSGGKDDARLVFGRRNASTARWSISVHGCNLTSRRTSGVDFDVDFVEANNDSLHVSPSCNYYNTLNPNNDISTGSGSLYRANPNVVYRTRTATINLNTSTGQISGTPIGYLYNAGALQNWEANVEVFASANGTNYTSRWADSSGKWRTKHGSTLASVTPSSDTDGTVIGTQT